MQLPHFTKEEIKHCAKGKTANRATNLGQYLAIPDNMKKGLAAFLDKKNSNVLRFCALFPNIIMETGVYVNDEKDNKVYKSDLLTIKVCITHNNLSLWKTKEEGISFRSFFCS